MNPQTEHGAHESILVIESDTVFADALKRALVAQGYLVEIVSKGAEALASILNYKPQLVMLDAVLAGTDAYQILASKCADSYASAIPTFLISREGMPINMRRVPEKSVVEFIVSMQTDIRDIVRRTNVYFKHNIGDLPSVMMPKTRKKILWIENDKLIVTILGKKLTTAGFDVTQVNTGEDAVVLLHSIIPDVLMLNLILPGLSGFDMLQKVHMNPVWKNIPTIVLTNLNKQSDIEKAHALGAQKFLIKASTSLDEVVIEIEKLVSKSSQDL